MNKLLLLASVCFLTACSGVSKEEEKLATEECSRFVEQSFSPVKETKVFDIYKKNESIVVEVGYKEYNPAGKGKSSYIVRLCVLNMKKGQISIPSIFEQSEWKK